MRPATEKKKENQNQNQNQNQTPVAALLVATKVATHQFAVAINQIRGSPTVTGKLSGVGRCGLAGPLA
ncbi:hypothetical protein, partial [Stenotrophomonas maltophilia]|uniref:hypothetical protein n=1 Tax=Stenotrophomonas maltophilia TaxID=40324 RepID=UPI001954B4FB